MINGGFSRFGPRSVLRSLFFGGAAAALLTGAAAAADAPKCQSMMRSFDRVVADGGKAGKLAEAKKHRKAGAAALAGGDEAACRKSLEMAQSSIIEAQRFMAIDEPDTAQ